MAKTAEINAGAPVRSEVDVEQLRFAPQILARLGEELNPNSDQGVLELVRNAYDADADRCRVQLENVDEPGGMLVIRDWGDGLSRSNVTEGWLVLGKSSKTSTRRTEKGRLQVGQKGLGRLAALRQGRIAELRTWPRSRKGAKKTTIEHQVVMDWDAFDQAETVDEVPVEVVTYDVEPTDCGTEITVDDLRRRWTRPELKRLARSLLLLSDPFGGKSDGFRVELLCAEHPDLENLVAGSYFSYSYYSIVASLDDAGRASLTLRDKRLGIEESVGHDEIAAVSAGRNGRPYEATSARFELHGFLRSADALQGMGSAATLGGLRDWLDAFGGVHIYHRGLRVAPYGDPGFDWLDMNLLRARNPEFRPSTNNAVGRMTVEDPGGLLIQKTDRSGFIEEEKFGELREFGRDVLEWVGRRRTRVSDELREKEKREGPSRREEASKSLDEAVDKLPPEQRKTVQRAVKKLEQAAEKDADQMRKDLILYRTLATIGTTSAQIAHETYNPALAIVDLAREIEHLSTDGPDGGDWKSIEPSVTQVAELAERLRDYARLPRVLLAEKKRQMRTWEADRAVADTTVVFQPLMSRHQVVVRETYGADGTKLRGPRALLDAILANFLINAVHALDDQVQGQREILVRTSLADDHFVLEVADSGKGIEEIDPKEIWVPGATTTTEGTGLGLTIVRDSASQLGGTAAVQAHGELGGAHFSVRLPVPS